MQRRAFMQLLTVLLSIPAWSVRHTAPSSPIAAAVRDDVRYSDSDGNAPDLLRVLCDGRATTGITYQS